MTPERLYSAMMSKILDVGVYSMAYQDATGLHPAAVDTFASTPVMPQIFSHTYSLSLNGPSERQQRWFGRSEGQLVAGDA